jgi:hypothetical protein
MNTNIIEEAVPPSEQAIRNVLSELRNQTPQELWRDHAREREAASLFLAAVSGVKSIGYRRHDQIAVALMLLGVQTPPENRNRTTWTRDLVSQWITHCRAIRQEQRLEIAARRAADAQQTQGGI